MAFNAFITNLIATNANITVLRATQLYINGQNVSGGVITDVQGTNGQITSVCVGGICTESLSNYGTGPANCTFCSLGTDAKGRVIIYGNGTGGISDVQGTGGQIISDCLGGICTESIDPDFFIDYDNYDTTSVGGYSWNGLAGSLQWLLASVQKLIITTTDAFFSTNINILVGSANQFSMSNSSSGRSASLKWFEGGGFKMAAAGPGITTAGGLMYMHLILGQDNSGNPGDLFVNANGILNGGSATVGFLDPAVMNADSPPTSVPASCSGNNGCCAYGLTTRTWWCYSNGAWAADVTSVVGTASQVTVSCTAGTRVCTASTPNAFIAPATSDAAQGIRARKLSSQTGTAPTFGSFSTGACSGGVTAPATGAISGGSAAFTISFTTGNGVCAQDADILAINLQGTSIACGTTPPACFAQFMQNSPFQTLKPLDGLVTFGVATTSTAVLHSLDSLTASTTYAYNINCWCKD